MKKFILREMKFTTKKHINHGYHLINKIKVLNILIISIISVLLSSYKPQYASSQATCSATNDAMKIIYSRKSVRHFTNKPVSKDQLNQILKAGMSAPTAINQQPWEFFVITNHKTLVALSKGLTSTPMLDKISAAIIVCGNTDKKEKLNEADYWMSLFAAFENILLAVEALGLGAVWTAVYPDNSKISFVRKTLRIPANYTPLICIPIGYPTCEDKPKKNIIPLKSTGTNGCKIATPKF